jgi:hypothetical protein
MRGVTRLYQAEIPRLNLTQATIDDIVAGTREKKRKDRLTERKASMHEFDYDPLRY